MSVGRIAVSLDREVLGKLEAGMQRGAHWNRSKVVSDILRDWFSREERAEGKGTAVGVISLVYGHHGHRTLERITGLQHSANTSVIASMHVHLSHEDCMEIIAARGRAARMQRLADSIACVRGVKSCRLTLVD